MGRGTSRIRHLSRRIELRPVVLHIVRSSVIPHRVRLGIRSHARFRGYVILLIVLKVGIPETARLGRGRSRVRATLTCAAIRSAGVVVARFGTTSEIRSLAQQCLRAACDDNRYTPTFIRVVPYKIFLLPLDAKCDEAVAGHWFRFPLRAGHRMR